MRAGNRRRALAYVISSHVSPILQLGPGCGHSVAGRHGGAHAQITLFGVNMLAGLVVCKKTTDRRQCARSPLTSHITQRDVLPGAHRAAATSCTPATRDRTGRLHRDIPGGSAACRNTGLLDDPGLASASRAPIARGPQAPGRAARPSRCPALEPGGIRASRPGSRPSP